jgi:hypothetical protein
MDHAALMRVMQCVADLDPQIDHLAPGQSPALLEDRIQGHTLDELHRDIPRTAELAPGQVPDDGGMTELVENLVLALEPPLDLVALGELAMDNLDGGEAPPLLVGRPVDDPHGAGAQHRVDPVRSELLFNGCELQVVRASTSLVNADLHAGLAIVGPLPHLRSPHPLDSPLATRNSLRSRSGHLA